jgi:uncharacterized protein YbaP (TraB family)
MSIQKCLFSIILISTSAIGYSQLKQPQTKNKAVTTPKSAGQKNGNNSLLWEISGRGLTQPSYLYGTMHIVCSEDAKLSEGLNKAIKAAKQVFFELDMDNMEEMMGVLKFARMNNGLKISDLVSPEEYIRLQEYFSKNKSVLPFNMMSRFKPYFITAIISEEIMNCEQKSSVEQLIMTEARQYDKDILGLETIEYQASIFDSIPYEKQAQDLVTYVDSIDKFRKVTLDMVDLYRKQDISKMDSLMIESDPGMMQYMDLLLYDRNKRWAMQMPESMFQMPTLFAVGAGHLGGSKGVIALLRSQGFTVKPLDNTKIDTSSIKDKAQVVAPSKK